MGEENCTTLSEDVTRDDKHRRTLGFADETRRVENAPVLASAVFRNNSTSKNTFRGSADGTSALGLDDTSLLENKLSFGSRTREKSVGNTCSSFGRPMDTFAVAAAAAAAVAEGVRRCSTDSRDDAY